MNRQLQDTLQALSGGLADVDPQTAISNVATWQGALSSLPGGENLVAGLGELQIALENGDLEAAADLLPDLGGEVESLIADAPEDDQAGLRQLADLLQG